ncbi:unnamed protein product [Photorhabdus laumondii subsp. laumondii TTO1]|uniref:Photorhabdus luminescens subsp. laumondii TTO1 complete genome segment 4/17 n=1 Tax=Photorhabdus laumondii subsp. laumondii (strain DSM 15139 / CIP 105565 / TT01) TaxID=243265 RepID=Q7N7J6_PHOLL|nr:unnamed protein product [Photorhabdus laumondii subsp. laumondii TTO1]
MGAKLSRGDCLGWRYLSGILTGIDLTDLFTLYDVRDEHLPYISRGLSPSRAGSR